MKTLTLLIALAITAPAWATPCFHIGKYSGVGIATDVAGDRSQYQVDSDLSSENAGQSHYVWNTAIKGDITLTYVVKGSDVYFNGNSTPSGQITCGLGANNLTVTTAKMSLTEESVFLGNYLIRHGMRTNDGKTYNYVELLIRQ